MMPLLKLAGDGETHNVNDATDKLAKEFNLTDEEISRLIPSGSPKFYNRVGWAKTHLKKAGLLEYPQRGYFRITQRGVNVLQEDPAKINMSYLKKFPEFIAFRQTHHTVEGDEDVEENEELTPEEALENAYLKIRDDLSDELLETILKSSPAFFEKLVVDLLINLGYGGSRKEAGEAFATTGDEGIDGVIKEDKLGLDLIYIQAKRWKSSSCVGRPEIQKFAGALQGKRARKGIFITTSYFSSEAKEYVKNIDSKIILIDGDELASLMFESNTGVSTESKYELKKIDTDYFSED
jgi:restriction system protein